ncbi:thioredoxin family protein, partial [Thiohalocapsa halophila]|uniref:thioredoxin family protein n=1 Tax=Thiohalocapsa halophila TaxID=69359 RepID=UPI0019042A4C
MKQIKILGSGRRNCEITANAIAKAAEQAGVEIELEKVTDIAAIMSYRVMSTPGVVSDNAVMHAGGVAGPDQVGAWMHRRRRLRESANEH